LKLAEGPRDMSRIARLAASKGSRTRAILKLAGRSAILLTVGMFNLAMWLFWAVVTALGFVASLKRAAERATERYCARRKLRRARAQRELLVGGRHEPAGLREAQIRGRHAGWLARRSRVSLSLIRATYPAAPAA